ncbi:hypothetical protein HPB47_019702 [Ixodes persulcatus]|uniref:Uncharacterized protein n=1 Tax=Ixodes persulcatus TaxID=34615 RepID=A0AC60QJN4_IXOPE|nr:hypothetical protein HPB47_019702 [Ixodes persulcatus]
MEEGSSGLPPRRAVCFLQPPLPEFEQPELTFGGASSAPNRLSQLPEPLRDVSVNRGLATSRPSARARPERAACRTPGVPSALEVGERMPDPVRFTLPAIPGLTARAPPTAALSAEPYQRCQTCTLMRSPLALFAIGRILNSSEPSPGASALFAFDYAVCTQGAFVSHVVTPRRKRRRIA